MANKFVSGTLILTLSGFVVKGASQARLAHPAAR